MAALRVELGARTVFEIGEEPSDRARRLFVDPASCAHPHTSQVITSFDPATGTMRGYRVDLHELPEAGPASPRLLDLRRTQLARDPEPRGDLQLADRLLGQVDAVQRGSAAAALPRSAASG